MIKISIPTPTEIEAVLVDMMEGTNAFSRWVKLDDAHLPCGGEGTRVGDTMWWADVIGPDGVGCDCVAAAPPRPKPLPRHGLRSVLAHGGVMAIRAQKSILTARVAFAI